MDTIWNRNSSHCLKTLTRQPAWIIPGYPRFKFNSFPFLLSPSKIIAKIWKMLFFPLSAKALTLQHWHAGCTLPIPHWSQRKEVCSVLCKPEGLPSLLLKLNTNTPLCALSDLSLISIKPSPMLCLHPGILQTSSCPAASGTSWAWTCTPELSPPMVRWGCLLYSKSPLFKCSWCSVWGMLT